MTLICPNIYVQNLKQNIYSLHERFFFWKIVIKVSKRNDNIFPSVSLMHWMKQNCKPTDEVNSFINKIVQMANGPIEVMTCAEDESDASYALSTLHLLDSGWWGRRKLPEGLPWFGRDCHRGQGGAEETGPDFILARWRGGGMVEYFIEQSLELIISFFEIYLLCTERYYNVEELLLRLKCIARNIFCCKGSVENVNIPVEKSLFLLKAHFSNFSSIQ